MTGVTLQINDDVVRGDRTYSRTGSLDVMF